MFISRRQALISTGITLAAGTVAGCATYGAPPTEPAREPAPGPTPGGSAAPAQAIAKTADVPVGSGLVIGDVVLTQPTPGKFSGFSSVCTHAGCTVSEVVDRSINCPCHGSSFNLDGTVAKGPAKRPLETKQIAVQGDSIVIVG
jgi:Rieske Fe-S protein